VWSWEIPKKRNGWRSSWIFSTASPDEAADEGHRRTRKNTGTDTEEQPSSTSVLVRVVRGLAG
jgi:hypothetical protein